jgi:hypothetical protein
MYIHKNLQINAYLHRNADRTYEAAELSCLLFGVLLDRRREGQRLGSEVLNVRSPDMPWRS